MNGWILGQTDGCMDRRMDAWMDGWRRVWKYGWMRMSGWIDEIMFGVASITMHSGHSFSSLCEL